MACRDCQYRELLPLSDEAIYGHLAGDHSLGLYPLLENDHCHLLAVDFDEQDWRDDARAFLRSYDRLFPNQDTLPRGGFGNPIAPRAPPPAGRDQQGLSASSALLLANGGPDLA